MKICFGATLGMAFMVANTSPFITSMLAIIVVGVTSDEISMSAKNKKPAIPFQERLEVVEAIKFVDEVVPQMSYDKLAARNNLKFDKMFVGDDWKGTDKWIEIERFCKIMRRHYVFITYGSYLKLYTSRRIK